MLALNVFLFVCVYNDWPDTVHEEDSKEPEDPQFDAEDPYASEGKSH